MVNLVNVSLSLLQVLGLHAHQDLLDLWLSVLETTLGLKSFDDKVEGMKHGQVIYAIRLLGYLSHHLLHDHVYQTVI